MTMQSYCRVVVKICLAAMFMLALSACVSKPQPQNVDNICKIFKQYPSWYWATQDSAKRWGVPINVQMAIVHQESSFSAKAKPERTKLLWVIPWKRPSTAVGYSQALKTTWEEYQNSVGKRWANRSAFHHAVDFIGWYGNQAYRQARVPRGDAYSLYLAYHEGIGGYQRKSYASKQWLINVAEKVQSQSSQYRYQLQSCQKKLRKKPWYRVW